MSPKSIETIEKLTDIVWQVNRYAMVEEVLMDDDSLRYHLTVRDEGRPPFIDMWFTSEAKAQDLLAKVRMNANDPSIRTR